MELGYNTAGGTARMVELIPYSGHPQIREDTSITGHIFASPDTLLVASANSLVNEMRISDQ